METQITSSSAEAASMIPPATGSSHINLSDTERVVSALGGAALTAVALNRLNSLAGVSLLIGGGLLLARGLSGYCPVTNYLQKEGQAKNASAMEIEEKIMIDAPRSTVYAFWRTLENLPQFMKHLDRVAELDDKRSIWTAKLPGSFGKISWKAEITNDISGELISWSSLPKSTIDNAGEVRFEDSADGQSTEVHVRISYRLPAGDLGGLAAKLFSPTVHKMMHDDISSFKRLMESTSRTVYGERGFTTGIQSNDPVGQDRPHSVG